MTFSYDMFESPFFFGVVFISFWSTSDHIYFELFFFSLVVSVAKELGAKHYQTVWK